MIFYALRYLIRNTSGALPLAKCLMKLSVNIAILTLCKTLTLTVEINGTEAIYDSTGLKKYVEYTSAFEKLRNYPRSRESPFSCFDLKKALFRSPGWKVPY